MIIKNREHSAEVQCDRTRCVLNEPYGKQVSKEFAIEAAHSCGQLSAYNGGDLSRISKKNNQIKTLQKNAGQHPMWELACLLNIFDHRLSCITNVSAGCGLMKYWARCKLFCNSPIKGYLGITGRVTSVAPSNTVIWSMVAGSMGIQSMIVSISPFSMQPSEPKFGIFVPSLR